MIIGIYLASYEDSIWFESTIKRKAEIIGNYLKLKMGFNLKLNLKVRKIKNT